MFLPGVYWSSTGSELRPVKKVEILALDENAPLLLLFQASTHGWESVRLRSTGSADSTDELCRVDSQVLWTGFHLLTSGTPRTVWNDYFSSGCLNLCWRDVP